MAEIHIFSGLLSSIVPQFRRGTEELTKRVNEIDDGVEAKHRNWIFWRIVAWRLIAKHRNARLIGPIILGGHSNGVLAARKVAKVLSKHGINVDYEFSIDPTIFPFPKVDHNVNRHDEVHATSGICAIFRYITFKRSGSIFFVDNWNGNGFYMSRKGGHVAIASYDNVHSRILDQVRQVL